MRDWKKEIFSIPNILSLFRLLLIPVYTVLFLRAERPADYWWAAGILAVSTLTDMIDGKIARTVTPSFRKICGASPPSCLLLLFTAS